MEQSRLTLYCFPVTRVYLFFSEHGFKLISVFQSRLFLLQALSTIKIPVNFAKFKNQSFGAKFNALSTGDQILSMN